MKKRNLVCALAVSTLAVSTRAATMQVLHELSGTDGIHPGAGLTIDSSGNLYGSTDTTIFSLTTTGGNFSLLHTFAAGVGQVESTLLLGSDKMLYGVTSDSNVSSGTIFKVSTAGAFTQLAAFNGSNGSAPLGSLIFDGLGNVVGACAGGGANSAGSLFKESTAGGTVSLMASFTTATTGSMPYVGLTLASDGYLYGAAGAGGANGDGTIYRIPVAGGSLSKVADFNGSNGSSPETNMIVSASGALIGTTHYGGASGNGNIFSYSSSGGITNFATFNGINGSYSEGALLADATGNMYSTTVSGGVHNTGTVYEVGKNGGTIYTLYSFDGTTGGVEGCYPYSTLVSDSAGNLYGTASETGSNGNSTGTVFKILGSGYIPVSTINASAPTGQITSIAAGTTGIQLTSVLSESIAAGGELKLNAASSSANRRLLVVGQGGLTIGTSSGGTYTGVLDLTNNDLLIVGGSLATVTAQIKSAFNNGQGGTGGIGSSAAASDSTHLHALGVVQNNQSRSLSFNPTHMFDGYTPGPSDILVKYTYFGDANLDGAVNSADYTLIDAGYLGHSTGWYNGDFNYDSVVNGSDYTLIDNAFNTQGAAIPSEAAATTEVAPLAPVPEPLIGCVLPAVMLGMRRRKMKSIGLR